MSHEGDRLVPRGSGRFIADQIPNARYVELDGHDTWFFVDRRVEEEIVSFVNESAATAARPDRVLAAVLFTDLVASTALVAEIGDGRSRHLLETHDSVSARIVAEHRGHLVRRTGDGLLATFDAPGRAVACAHALAMELQKLGLQLRAGVHVGEIELRDDDIGGMAVHIAARVMSLAQAGEVIVSRTVKDLTAGSGLAFEPRGDHVLKGVPDSWELYVCTTP
jgi:class 3 adenylate cyclase